MKAQRIGLLNFLLLDTLGVPALEMAIGMGNPMMANFILLGVYVGRAGVVPPEAVEARLEKKFGGREMASATNREAFCRGIELAASRL